MKILKLGTVIKILPITWIKRNISLFAACITVIQTSMLVVKSINFVGVTEFSVS